MCPKEKYRQIVSEGKPSKYQSHCPKYKLRQKCSRIITEKLLTLAPDISHSTFNIEVLWGRASRRHRQRKTRGRRGHWLSPPDENLGGNSPASPLSSFRAENIAWSCAAWFSFAGLKIISQIDHLRHSLETVNQRLFFMRNKKVSAKVRWEAYYGSFTVSYAIWLN